MMWSPRILYEADPSKCFGSQLLDLANQIRVISDDSAAQDATTEAGINPSQKHKATHKSMRSVVASLTGARRPW
jgi:hypothetical protein